MPRCPLLALTPALWTAPRSDGVWHNSETPGWLPGPDGISGTKCPFPDKHRVI